LSPTDTVALAAKLRLEQSDLDQAGGKIFADVADDSDALAAGAKLTSADQRFDVPDSSLFLYRFSADLSNALLMTTGPKGTLFRVFPLYTKTA